MIYQLNKLNFVSENRITFQNKETAAVWHDLLENWERVENFYANAKDFRMVVSTIKENFEVQNGIKIRSMIEIPRNDKLWFRNSLAAPQRGSL